MDRIVVLLWITVSLRLISVGISKMNEWKLRKMGAIEYGRRNSALLTLSHFVFYGACLAEGYQCLKTPDAVSIVGIVLYVLAIGMLYYVIYALRHIWTIKLFIAPRSYHTLVHTYLFRRIKHPNYYLSVIPELIGIAMIFHAWYTLFWGLALYAVPLFIRIRQEELAMRRELNHN